MEILSGHLPLMAGSELAVPLQSFTCFYFPPLCSYDNVLAIDPGHWRSLLNKAVVQASLHAACLNTCTTEGRVAWGAHGCTCGYMLYARRTNKACSAWPHCLPQTCTDGKGEAAANLKQALKLSGGSCVPAGLGSQGQHAGLPVCSCNFHPPAIPAILRPLTPAPLPPGATPQAAAARWARRWNS